MTLALASAVPLIEAPSFATSNFGRSGARVSLPNSILCDSDLFPAESIASTVPVCDPVIAGEIAIENCP